MQWSYWRIVTCKVSWLYLQFREILLTQCRVWIVELNTEGKEKNLVGYLFSSGKKWGGGSGNGRGGCRYSDSEKDSWSWMGKTQWIWHTECDVENRIISRIGHGDNDKFAFVHDKNTWRWKSRFTWSWTLTNGIIVKMILKTCTSLT